VCLDTRLALDISQQSLAATVGVTRSYIAQIERGDANPSIALIESIAVALGLELELLARPPVILGNGRIQDLVHARCSAYADRRLRGHGLETAREVEIVHGRSHGWIDLLAFDPRTGVVLLIEVKTRLNDLGAVERQIGWYERAAWSIARDLGWEPRRMRSWLLVLASAEIDDVVWANRIFFGAGFAIRANEMRLDLRGATEAWIPGRGLAMIDPSNRGRDWLIRTRADGRRSPARYADYADAARRAVA
jgi:transcriptional regulator with XRE-family HTH domain